MKVKGLLFTVSFILTFIVGYGAGSFLQKLSTPKDFKTAIATTAIKTVTKPVIDLVECNRRIDRRDAAVASKYQEELLEREREYSGLKTRFQTQVAKQGRELSFTKTRLDNLHGYIKESQSICQITEQCLVSRALIGVHSAASGDTITRN